MKNFFSIESKEQTAEGQFTYNVMINKDHAIFQGHFPGNPIVPGVVTMMMVRMCAEDALGLEPTRYASVKEAKYFKPVRPDGKMVTISMSIDDSLTLKADVCDPEGNAMTKVKGTLLKA